MNNFTDLGNMAVTENRLNKSGMAMQHALYEEEEAIDLRKYWHIAKRHLRIILSIAALASVLATLIVYSMRPVYLSTATLMVESPQSKMLLVGDIYEMGTLNDKFFQTQYEILKSRDLAQNVITKLNLAKNPEFTGKPSDAKPVFWRHWLAWLPAVFDTQQEKETIKSNSPDIAQREELLSRFLKRLSINPRKLTQLVDVSFEAHDPDLARLVVDTLGEIFIESSMTSRILETQKATDLLAERLGPLKGKLTASEKNLQEYLNKEHLIDLAGVLTLTKGEIDQNSERLAEAKAARMQAETLYNKVKSMGDKLYTSLDIVPEVLADPSVQSLKEKQEEVTRKISELSQRYGTEHPAMQSARTELDSINRQLKSTIAGSVNSIRSRYEIALANERGVASSLDKNKAQVRQIGQKQTYLNELQREVDTNRNLYETFFKRYKEASEVKGLNESYIRFIDRANQPLLPVKPKKGIIIILAFITALIAGVMLAFLLDHLDNTLKSAEDVERKLGVSLLGLLPFQPIKKSDMKPQFKEIGQLVTSSPNSGFAEGIRTIRTGLILSAIDSRQNTWLLTSSASGEGKSVLAYNLAASLAQMKQGKILLIDADLRRPQLSKNITGVTKETLGLAHVLSKTAKLENCIYSTPHDFDFMPVGMIPPNPSELLSSKVFSNLLDEIGQHYSHVLVDSPPIHVVSDSYLLAQHVRAVIYLIKAEETPVALVNQGLKLLQRIGAPLAGVVLNQIDVKKSKDYGASYYYYGSAYGTDEASSQT
ncbi:MAG: GumC family protein [Gammaproteobacteria bacterium]